MTDESRRPDGLGGPPLGRPGMTISGAASVFNGCPSPLAYTGAPDDSYTVMIRAVDTAAVRSLPTVYSFSTNAGPLAAKETAPTASLTMLSGLVSTTPLPVVGTSTSRSRAAADGLQQSVNGSSFFNVARCTANGAVHAHLRSSYRATHRDEPEVTDHVLVPGARRVRFRGVRHQRDRCGVSASAMDNPVDFSVDGSRSGANLRPHDGSVHEASTQRARDRNRNGRARSTVRRVSGVGPERGMATVPLAGAAARSVGVRFLTLKPRTLVWHVSSLVTADRPTVDVTVLRAPEPEINPEQYRHRAGVDLP